MVGERVLVSRAGDGAGHEEATVIDFYEVLVDQDSTPTVVVDFDDGERKYIAAQEPDVMAMDEDEDPDWDEEDEDPEPEDEDEDEGDE
jgi:hypothetical protein